MILAPIIHTEKLRKVYAVGKERVVALNNVDLSIEKGEFCCIVGQSGSWPGWKSPPPARCSSAATKSAK